MVQIVGPSPRAMQLGQIGQAIGQGIGINSQQNQMRSQQGQLAKQLFGNQGNQFANLPVEDQFKAAQFMQNQQASNQQNMQKQQELASQQNLASHLFPDQADKFGQLPIQQQLNLANLFKKQKDSDLKDKVINSLFGSDEGENAKESNLLSDSQIASVATVDPNLAKILQKQKESKLLENREQQKMEEKQKKERMPFETAQRSFNIMSQLLKKGNLGVGSGILGSAIGGERAKDVAQFTSATGGLEAMLVDMVSRGALSDSRFKYITQTLLPKPGDRDKEIEGKMIALADMLGLDSSELTGNKKVEPGKKQSLEDLWK